MGLSNELVRRALRPTFSDPSFRDSGPGYSQPSAVDSAGYTLADPLADSMLPDRYGVDLEPSPGGAIYGAPPVSSSVHSELGFGAGAMEMQHAVRSVPLEYEHGSGPEFATGYAVGPRVGSLYDGGGWPEPATGSYRGPLRAARARAIAQELGSRDDYGRGGSSVDDLGRPSPGGLRNVTRGEYGD